MPRRSAESSSSGVVRSYAPLLFITVVVTALHAMPGGELGAHDWWVTQRLDLVLHSFLFGIWGLTALIAFRKGGGPIGFCRNAWGISIVLGLLLGLSLELAQGVVFPGRGGDAVDLIADFFGLIAAGFAFRALYLKWPVGKRTL
jgi:hypothetical protein